jgi:hypothetical protein
VERVLDDPAWVRDREETIRQNFQPTNWHETATQVLVALDALPVQGRRSEWPRLSHGNEMMESVGIPSGRALKTA